MNTDDHYNAWKENTAKAKSANQRVRTLLAGFLLMRTRLTTLCTLIVKKKCITVLIPYYLYVWFLSFRLAMWVVERAATALSSARAKLAWSLCLCKSPCDADKEVNRHWL